MISDQERFQQPKVRIGSLWEASCAENAGATPLDKDLSVDLAVIGGGFTGNAAALEAAKSGASVCLLEARGIGHGGSGRNVGLVNAGLWLPPDRIFAQLGPEAGMRLYKVLSDAPAKVFSLIETHGVDCEATRAGTLHCAHSPGGVEELRNRLQQGNRLGSPAVLIDADETRRRTGASGLYGALFDPRAGTVQPLGLCRGLARAAREAGAHLHENTPVTSLSREGEDWIVSTGRHKVRARAILVATNAYHLGIEMPYRPEFTTVSFFQCATEPMPRSLHESILPGGEGCWDTALVMSSFRIDRQNRLIIGGIGDLDGPGRAVHRAWARRKLRSLFPRAAHLSFTHEWCGRIAMTGDHIPKILEFGPNALACFGYSGRGIAPGIAFGSAAANTLLAGDARTLPIDPIRHYTERFKSVRRAYHELGATLAHALAPVSTSWLEPASTTKGGFPMSDHMHPDDIRTLFSRAMSDMYRQEVPQYGALIELVREVNAATLAADPELKRRMEAANELDRLDVERHGAIRLGTAEELFNIRRMFAVMGMFPVGYYDLSVAGLPVHSTAFRPISETALARNPFRVFTSLIRLELLEDRSLADKAAAILNERRIITGRALELITRAEEKGGLTETQAKEFVTEALETFRWHAEATVNKQTYDDLNRAHRLIADVVSFRGPHINHLTPRTLDIDAVQSAMPERGITPKAVVEGPPRRQANILLRQTSFKALEERIRFRGEAGIEEGTHTARFGEIEQRGVALTPKGRALYDETLAKVRRSASIDATGGGAERYKAELEEQFAAFPDDWNVLRREGLAYFRYRAAEGAASAARAESIEALLASGALICDPQIYEDFLPVSAAGIFQSNLGTDEQSNYSASANRDAFEAALGASVADEMSLYAKTEAESLRAALSALGQDHLVPAARVA